MTRKLTFLILVLFALISGPGWGQTYEQVMELDMTTQAIGCSAYNTTTTYGDWKITNGANNNKGWAYFKMGGKNTTISSYNPCYIYSTVAGTEQIDKITVSLPAGSLSKSGMSVNSWGVYVYSNSEMTDQIDFVAGGTITNSAATFDFYPSDGKTWASGYFYKVSWDLANTTTTNGIVCVDKITLYKASGPTTYTVTYNANGATSGDVPADGTQYNPSASVTVLGNTGNLARTNYTFGGWNTQADGEGTTYQAGNTFEISANTTLYAKWIADPKYNLTYKANGGVGEDVVEQYFNNEAVTISNCTFTYEGHRFVNWNTAADGTGTSYEIGATYTMTTADLTLYAQWEEVTSASYVFNTDAGLAALGITKPSSSAGTNLGTKSYISGNISMNATDGSTPTRVWNSSGSTDLRIYNGGSLSFSIAGGNIVKIELTGNTTDVFSCGETGTFTNGTWTGSAPSVTLTATATGKINTIEVTYISAPQTKVTAPAITPNGGNVYGSQSVSISCSTDGATILYTTDNGANWNTYVNPFNVEGVSGTATVKAKATLAGMEDSDEVSATFTFAQTYSSVETVNAITENDIPIIVSMNNWTITSISGNDMYVTDGTTDNPTIHIFDYNIPDTYTLGGKLTGSLKAIWVEYNEEGEVATVQNWNEINYSAPTFVINIDEDLENGTIVATPTTATAGTEISFTVTPNEGYRMTAESLSVKRPTGESVTFSGSNPYTFTMPNSDVTISAEFELLPTTTYQYLYSVNGISGDELEAYEGESITLATSENLNDDFTFAGWTTDESDVENILAAGSDYTVDDDVIFYAVYSKTIEGPVPSAYTAGDEGTFVIASNIEGTYYAIPQNPTVSSGKIDGVSIQTSTENDVTYVTAANAAGYSWTIANATYGQTMSDGSKYLYHSNGGASGTNLTYGNSTSYTWNIISEANGLSFQAMNEATTNNRGLLCQTENVNKFGGYALSNEDKDDYSRIVVLPIKSDMVSLYTRVYNANTTINDNLTVAGPSIILSGKTLTVTGTMENTNPANLVIEDGAQLIHHNAGVNATVKKSITGYTDPEGNDGYYLIANPTDNATVAHLTENNYDLYTFDPTQALEWHYEKESNTLTSGIGYLYANSETVTLEFAGKLLPAGSTDVDLVYAEEGAGIDFPGFNLIGNPYACNATISGDYTFLKIDDDAIIPSTGSVAPCEGIFVEATAAEQSVTFTPALPASQAAAPSAMSIEVSQNRGNVIDRAIVRFDGANNLHKFMLNPAHTNLSIAKGSETFAAISTEAEGELPVNFKAEKNGTYTITVDTENVDAEYLHLIDNMTGMDVDLLSTPSYTFEAKTSDYASRFKLVFGVNNTASESSDSDFAYMSDSNLVIDNIEGEATLQIVDELGRVISTETVSGSYNKALNLRAGLYIINLNGMTQKIVVK